jgi:predicted ATPase/class 3 adenylate cyclase
VNIAEWLDGLGLGQYAGAFTDNAIDAAVLPKLTAEDLREIGVAAVGHRRRLLDAIAAFAAPPTPDPAANPGNLSTSQAAPERRLLTVMFCDLVGSTPLSARLDPEDLREVIQAYQRAIAATVKRFAGFVAKYMGDGVLVYFGYPQANEHDVEQAVRAGLAIIEAVGGLTLAEDVAVRVGIATGMVIVGDLIGEGSAQEQAVVGETPNLAARLQTLAEPGTVVIADETRRLIGGLFEANDLGPQALRGFGEGQRVWRVVRESREIDRFAALRSGRSRLIGRKEELDLLLRRWSQAVSGQGRVVLLSGEPGIGKSRLTAALQDRLADVSHTRLRYFCSPQHQDSTLYPMIAQLERAAGFVRDDSPETRLDKLATLLSEAAHLGDISLIAEMMSLQGGTRYPALDLSPARKRERTILALQHQLEGLARRGPVLLIFEDLHWIDPSTREVVDRIVERIATLPVLVILTFRPEFEPPWLGQAHATAMALDRLNKSDGMALVRQIVRNALSADLIDEIAERTDGVPLFVEELTKAVVEVGDDRREAMATAVPGTRQHVPMTLNASLMGRLDRLGSAARRVAQVGAAIGRDFSYDLVSAASELDEAILQGALGRLVDAGLLFQRGAPATAYYLFKHALIQDAAYSTLLRSARRNLHRRIAEQIVSRFADMAETQPEVVAHHCSVAQLNELAMDYWLKAGQRAADRSANVEAIGHLRRGMAMLDTVAAQEARNRRELGFQIALAMPLMATRGYSAPETGEACTRARILAETLREPALLLRALYGLWTFTVVGGSIRDSRVMAERFLAVAEEQHDDDAVLVGTRILGVSLQALGLLDAAQAAFERVLDRYEPAAHRPLAYRFGQDQRIAAHAFLSIVLWVRGFPDRARAMAQQAIAEANELDHANSFGYALGYGACATFALSRDWPNAEALAAKLIAHSEEHAAALWHAFGIAYKGWADLAAARHSDAVAGLSDGIERFRAVRSGMRFPLHLGQLSEAIGYSGATTQAAETVREAIALCEGGGERWVMPELLRIEARLRIATAYGGGFAAAEQRLREALAIARDQDARSWELRIAVDLARLLLNQGHREQARDLLAPIYGWFTEGFDTLDLKDAAALLRQLM